MRRGSFQAIGALPLLLLLVSCGANSPESPGGLTCTVSPASGEVPLTVTFSATSNDASPADYHWTFSDATAAFGQKVQRIFFTGGMYTGRVTLTTTGESCETAPVAVGAAVRLTCFADPEQVIVPGEVHFRAEPEGGNGSFTYAWDFGDGATSTDKAPSHAYKATG